MQVCDQKKTSAKIVPKSDLGGSWAPCGKGLGRSSASWGHFGAHFDCLLDVPNHIFLDNGPRWTPRGVLDSFWIYFGKVWEDLDASWKNLGFQNQSCCVTWSFLEHSECPLLPRTLLQEPPRCLASHRGASQLKTFARIFEKLWPKRNFEEPVLRGMH